jgi:hypothetical protein
VANKNDPGAEPHPKSYAERLDPGGEVGKQAQGIAALAGSPFARVLRSLGVEQETLDQAKELAANYQKLVSEPERIAPLLAPLGWVFHGLAHVDAYGAAATLVEQGRVEEAEELLVETYNDDDHAFIRFYHRVISLYQGDEERREIGLARLRVLDEAYELHKERRYAAAIPLVLAQIDGIFIDMTARPAKYFYDSKNPNLVDDITLAGHPQGLKALSELMGENAPKTVISDRLTRQGILHGRVLAYDTLRNATKTWAALLAVIEAVGPRAQELTKQAAEAHEQRYAGSKEVDEWGIRLDRRGFDAAHGLLNSVHLYQHGKRKHKGRFAADRQQLDPDRSLLKRYDAELEMGLADDGGYWAWTETPPGIVFGIAARDDDFNNYWVYAAEEPPKGGLGEDERWRHITDPELSPDW